MKSSKLFYSSGYLKLDEIQKKENLAKITKEDIKQILSKKTNLQVFLLSPVRELIRQIAELYGIEVPSKREISSLFSTCLNTAVLEGRQILLSEHFVDEITAALNHNYPVEDLKEIVHKGSLLLENVYAQSSQSLITSTEKVFEVIEESLLVTEKNTKTAAKSLLQALFYNPLTDSQLINVVFKSKLPLLENMTLQDLKKIGNLLIEQIKNDRNPDILDKLSKLIEASKTNRHVIVSLMLEKIKIESTSFSGQESLLNFFLSSPRICQYINSLKKLSIEESLFLFQSENSKNLSIRYVSSEKGIKALENKWIYFDLSALDRILGSLKDKEIFKNRSFLNTLLTNLRFLELEGLSRDFSIYPYLNRYLRHGGRISSNPIPEFLILESELKAISKDPEYSFLEKNVFRELIPVMIKEVKDKELLSYLAKRFPRETKKALNVKKRTL